jgi:Cu(I)/Ag(I) efflux system protein CusF
MKSSGALSIALLTMALSAHAQAPSSRQMPVPSAAALAASKVLSRGRVLSVDKASGLVTLRHGRIRNMNMPAATTQFVVADKKSFEAVKACDPVKFHVEKVNGAPTVTYIRPRR